MKKLGKVSNLLVVGVASIAGLCAVCAEVSATAYTFTSLGSGYSEWLSDKFTATYDKLYSKFKSTATVNTTLTMEPRTMKVLGSSAGKVSMSNFTAGVYKIGRHTDSVTGKSYWIKVENNGAIVSENYNIITSDVVQS